MGGRGANSGIHVPQGFRVVCAINGTPAIQGTRGEALPSTHVPVGRFYRLDSKGQVNQYREYAKSGNALKDIDWGHIHKGISVGIPHTHD